MRTPAKSQTKDSRRREPRTTETPYALPRYTSLADWQARAAQLRQHVLASAGLLPFPAKTPLRARIFGRSTHPGYTVEKVCFESLPGFLLSGNLWRPAGAEGPFPGVLCPHGHWTYGRLENGALGSVPGRCVDLARQGYVVFSYDMIGYNDSKQIPHARIGSEIEEMWGISLAGLQLWNSIRSLDFLCALSDVDPERIGCTGASGGGTQTFLLTAVDDRVKVSAPVNMISSTFQGGCICENPPALRLDASNVEIGALMAPRPMLMVSCTGDWTKNTPELEYPWIRGIYELYGAAGQIASHQVDADHNYNLESRRAVYKWFGRWLHSPRLRAQDVAGSSGFDVADPADLLAFFNKELPTLRTERLTAQTVRAARKSHRDRWPSSKASLSRYRRSFGPSYRAALSAEVPSMDDISAETGTATKRSGVLRQTVTLSRRGRGDRVPGVLLTPSDRTADSAVLVVSGSGVKHVASPTKPHSIVAGLLAKGAAVMAIDAFGAASRASASPTETRFFTTYNRTSTANSVQDVLTAVAWLGAQPGVKTVSLLGLEAGGMWCLLARALAPAVAACVVDTSRFDTDSDEQWADRFFVPLLRRAGDVQTAVALAGPGRLLLHNTGETFATAWVTRLYRMLGAPENLSVSSRPAGTAAAVTFLLPEK